MKKITWLLILICVISPAFAEQPAERFEKVVNKMVTAINERDYAGIGNDFDRTMEEFLPLEKRKEFFESVLAQYGQIRKLDKPRLTQPDQTVFVAHFEKGVLDMKVWLSDDNKITGLLLLPHTPQIPALDRNKTNLSVPFRGKWLVVWGGDTRELNQHHEVPNQRFAFDILGVGPDGKTRRGEDNTNEDYYAFGREILAPADGNVTDVITGVRDNVPGSMNPYSALGNAVFIQHSENEISVMAHLKFDSVMVKVGDEVKAGQKIGLCGNSGNSSEPHLHYHLQNTPIIQDGTGIKCYFEKVGVIKDDKEQSKENYSPIKGDIINAE